MFDVWLLINIILWYAAIDRLHLKIKQRGILTGLILLSAINLIGSLIIPVMALLAVGNFVVLKMWLSGGR